MMVGIEDRAFFCGLVSPQGWGCMGCIFILKNHSIYLKTLEVVSKPIHYISVF